MALFEVTHRGAGRGPLATSLVVTIVACLSSFPAAAQTQAPSSDARAEAYYEFIRGRDLNARGETAAAIDAFLRAAELAPEAADVRSELAEVFAQEGRVESAIDVAERALAIDPDNHLAHWVLGNVYAAFADQPVGAAGPVGPPDAARRAVDHLTKAREPLVFNPQLELRLGGLQVRLGEFDEAVVTLEALALSVPDAGDVVLVLADAYEGAERIGDAVAMLERFIADQPFSRGLRRLADLYEEQDRWSDSVAVLRQAIAGQPETHGLHVRLARALLGDGQPEAARDELRGVIDRSEDVAGALLLLVRVELQLGDFAAAEVAARRLQEAEPETLRGSYALAEVLQRQRQPQRLIEALSPVVAAQRAAGASGPGVAGLLAQIGFAELELERPLRALALFRDARSQSPGDETLDYYVISSLLDADRADDALTEIERARQRLGGDLRLARLEARALQATGQRQRSIEVMTEALARHRDDPTAHVALAGLYLDADELDEATRILREAGDAFPDDPGVFFQLGAVFERQQRYGEAEQAFLRVLSTNPEHAPALNYLGYMLAERGERLEASVGYVQRALELDPANGSYLDSLGWAFFKMNRLEEASVQLARASDQLQTNSVVQDHLAQVLFALERYEEAIAAWERALAGDGESIDRRDVEQRIQSAREKVR